VAYRKRKKRQQRMNLLNLSNSVVPMPIQVINGTSNTNNSIGQRAWPEISGYPPVFGNFVGEVAHTGGGSYIWTGFSWEPAILGG